MCNSHDLGAVIFLIVLKGVNMKSSDFNKQKNVLRQIANASDAIRRKHKILKLGKMTTETAMGEVFKPVVTPLEKLVNQQIVVKPEDKIKIEKNDDELDRTLNEFDRTFDRTFATAHGDSSDELDTTICDNVSKDDNLSSRYLKMFDTEEKKHLDLSYGVRKLYGNRLMIGDSAITFNDDMMYIGDQGYQQTKGLLELLFKKEPKETLVRPNDMENYRKILDSTNAYRKYYSRDNAIRNDSSAKFKKIIASFVDSPAKKTPKRRSQTSGKGLPRHLMARKANEMDYVYWDDPNELVERLQLLLTSQAAGNSSHTNEIMSIMEELREAGIIY